MNRPLKDTERRLLVALLADFKRQLVVALKRQPDLTRDGRTNYAQDIVTANAILAQLGEPQADDV
jgi:hypothetical protein